MSAPQFLKSWGLWNSAPTPESKRQILKKAIDDLNEVDVLVEERQQYMRRKCDGLLLEAKDRVAKRDRMGAKGCLKRRRQCEAEYMKLMLTSDIIATHRLALEGAMISEVLLNALKTSAEAMRTINAHASIEDVEKLMDKLQDHSQNASEIGDALSQPVVKFDEDELERELDELMGIEHEPLPRHPPSSPALSAVSSSSSVSSAVQSASSAAAAAAPRQSVVSLSPIALQPSVVPPPSLVAAALSAPATTATMPPPRSTPASGKKALQLAQ
jgi:hypothetical protein